MNELIKLFSEKGFLFPIQAIIIAANVYFVSKSEMNHDFLLSLILVLSTLVLQTFRRRFLLLYPINLPMNRRSSAHIDTYYLRIVLILSMLFLVLGVSLTFQERFAEFNTWIGKYLLYFILLFLVIAPFPFWLFSKQLNEAIANKLKRGGSSFSMEACPFCCKPSALYERSIIDKGKIKVNIQCH